MTREQELNEFAAIMNALCAKYKVQPIVTFRDLSLEGKNMNEEQVQVSDENVNTDEPAVENTSETAPEEAAIEAPLEEAQPQS